METSPLTSHSWLVAADLFALTPNSLVAWLLLAWEHWSRFLKSGFSGIGMIHVLIFAYIFGARDSTGILLPLLIVAISLSTDNSEKKSTGVTFAVAAASL